VIYKTTDLVLLAEQLVAKATPLPTISASTTSTNISCPFLFSDLHSTLHCNFCLTHLLGRLVQDRGKSVADHSRCQKRRRLVTLNHRLSLLLIPSERRVSRFLFTSLHPVCLHSELKYCFRRYILFPMLNTLPLFPNCSGIIDKQVVQSHRFRRTAAR